MRGSEQEPQKASRSVELQADKAGRLQAPWTLTPTEVFEPVRITFPPMYVLPVIFVPGIMGSNLCDMKGRPVWPLNGLFDIPVDLVHMWRKKTAGDRQAVLHPARTTLFDKGGLDAAHLHEPPQSMSVVDGERSHNAAITSFCFGWTKG
jgi:hypothetical protein